MNVSESTGPAGSSDDDADSPARAGVESPGASGRRRVRLAEPTQKELDALPLEKRLELLEQRRQSRHQWFNSVGILFGVLFTAAGLIVTSLTWRTGQEELRNAREGLATAQEGQVTDRYTKAVEQLSSSRRDVRTAAVYALERIATDSDRDRIAIRDVLAAFVRENDPARTVRNDDLPKEPDSDVQAALTVLARRPAEPQRPVSRPGPYKTRTAEEARRGLQENRPVPVLDLHGVRVPGARLLGANLAGANLEGAGLSGAFLDLAILKGANLSDADLSGAQLVGTDLSGTDLSGANLTGVFATFTTLAHAEWSEETVWPKGLGGRKGMLARSEPFGEGRYRIRQPP
ncbi:pentapeptide repeat-containing protein [Spirillospora sp. NPDC047279]|uniref:pentapeptide repeat-containing protein n=1 Tax=Spirillospora sp. NPDC047279 TaxID=3155478 RepID=UPI00340D6E77